MNQQLLTREVFATIMICLLWTFLGTVGSSFAVIGVVATFVLLLASGNFSLFLLTFYCLLVFSDSYSEMYVFAKTIKPLIALMFGLIGFLVIRKYKIRHPFIKMFMPFIVLAILTIVAAEEYFTVFMKTLSYIFIMVATPAILIYSIKKKGNVFLKGYFVIAFLIMILGIIAKYTSYDFSHLNGRFRGMFGNPNGLGLFVVVNYLFYQVVKRKIVGLISKTENIAIMLAFFASLYLCQSRTSILVILIFHSFLFLNKRSPILSFIFLLSTAFGYTFIVSNALWLVQVLGLEGYARMETLESGSGRYIAWNFIWDNIKGGTILFGHGISGTEHLFAVNYKMLADMGHQGHAHNSYLTLWYDVGLVGLLAFLTGLLRSFFISRKDPVIFPIIIGVLISNNFESWITASLNPYTIVLYMILTILILGDISKINLQKNDQVKLETEIVNS